MNAIGRDDDAGGAGGESPVACSKTAASSVKVSKAPPSLAPAPKPPPHRDSTLPDPDLCPTLSDVRSSSCHVSTPMDPFASVNRSAGPTHAHELTLRSLGVSVSAVITHGSPFSPLPCHSARTRRDWSVSIATAPVGFPWVVSSDDEDEAASSSIFWKKARRTRSPGFSGSHPRMHLPRPSALCSKPKIPGLFVATSPIELNATALGDGPRKTKSQDLSSV